MTDQYNVKFLEGGKWLYLASPNMNNTTAIASSAYKMPREMAQRYVSRFKCAGYQEVMFALAHLEVPSNQHPSRETESDRLWLKPIRDVHARMDLLTSEKETMLVKIRKIDAELQRLAKDAAPPF